MSSRVLAAIERHARLTPDACALQGETVRLGYADLHAAIQALAPMLSGRRVGVLMDNSPAWAVVDLATLQAGSLCVPLPVFFSPAQLAHVLTDAGVDLLITDQPERARSLVDGMTASELPVAGQVLSLFRLRPYVTVERLTGIVKVTYTSGTTGSPKGVCLPGKSIDTVVESLCTATRANEHDRALALLPLSTLLENIGSLYAPLMAGGCAVLPSLSSLGMQVSRDIDVAKLLRALQQHQPTSVILIPQLLQVFVQAVEAGIRLPGSLRWMAVGGAPVARSLLLRAQALGLPVYQGYGLSEATSVVALNTPAAQRIGSVGQPLPHAAVRIAPDGEILVSGALFGGYLHGAHTLSKRFWPTGDLGYQDAEGFLYVTGRKKHIFITSFGRNVSPEWVESELTADAAIAQAVLFGEARPFNVAVIVPHAGRGHADIRSALERVNATLPDYAQVAAYVLADAAFSTANGLLNLSGKPRRAHIALRYAQAIRALYTEVA